MKLLRAYLQLIAVLVLFVPVVYLLNFEFVYTFVQVRFFHILIEAALFPLIFLWIWDPASRPHFKALTTVYILFIGYIIFINIFSLSTLKSYFGVWERFGAVYDLSIVFCYYLLLVSIFKSKKHWIQYINFITIAGLFVALFGWIQFFGLFNVYYFGSRLFSTLGNPAYLAAFLLLTVGLTVYLIITTAGKIKLWYVLVLALHLPILWFTQTRAGILGLLIAGVVLFYTYATKSNALGRAKYLISVLILTILLISIVQKDSINVDVICSRTFKSSCPRLVRLDKGTFETRKLYWYSALEAIAERPFIGWGDSNFDIALARFHNTATYEKLDSKGRAPLINRTLFRFDRTHNQYLDRLLASGMIGFFLYFLLLIIPLRTLLPPYSSKDNDTNIIAAFLMGYYVYLFFFFDSIGDALLMAVYLAFVSPVKQSKADLAKKKISSWISVAAIVLGLGLTIVLNINDIISNFYIRKAFNSNNYAVRVKQYDDVWSLSARGQRLIVDDLSTALASTYTNSADRILILDRLARWTPEVIRQYPYELKYNSSLINTYIKLAVFDAGFIQSARALSDANILLSPREPLYYALRGQLNWLQAEIAASDQLALRASYLEDMRYAYSLAPHIVDFELLYGIALERLTDATVIADIINTKANEINLNVWSELIEYYKAENNVQGLALIRSKFQLIAGELQYISPERRTESDIKLFDDLNAYLRAL